MDIGWAVNAMKRGQRVRRAGWNGKGMWLAYASDFTFNAPVPEPDNSNPAARTLPFVLMRTADVGFVPWLCSQTDLLAQDWEDAG